MGDVDAMLERTAVDAQGHAASDTRVPLTFPEVADALSSSRDVLEAARVFTPNMLERVMAVLRA